MNAPMRGVERHSPSRVRCCFTVVQGSCVSSSGTATATGAAPFTDRTSARDPRFRAKGGPVCTGGDLLKGRMVLHRCLLAALRKARYGFFREGALARDEVVPAFSTWVRVTRRKT